MLVSQSFPPFIELFVSFLEDPFPLLVELLQLLLPDRLVSSELLLVNSESEFLLVLGDVIFQLSYCFHHFFVKCVLVYRTQLVGAVLHPFFYY